MGHHRECDMPIPTMPVANFILVKTGFAFGFFNALLDSITSRGDLNQRQQVGRGRRIGEIEGDLGRVLTEHRANSQLSRPGSCSWFSTMRWQAQS